MREGKAKTGRDREGEGDVEVLLVAFIVRCTYGSVDGSACGCIG